MIYLLTWNEVNVPIYIAFLELSWTVFTFAHAGVQNVQQLYVFRFLYVYCPSRFWRGLTFVPVWESSRQGTIQVTSPEHMFAILLILIDYQP